MSVFTVQFFVTETSTTPRSNACCIPINPVSQAIRRGTVLCRCCCKASAFGTSLHPLHSCKLPCMNISLNSVSLHMYMLNIWSYIRYRYAVKNTSTCGVAWGQQTVAMTALLCSATLQAQVNVSEVLIRNGPAARANPWTTLQTISVDVPLGSNEKLIGEPS